MTTFALYNEELDLKIKFRILDIEHCENFLDRYEELPRSEYILMILNACVANIDSEVRPIISKLDIQQADHTLTSIYNGCIMLNPILDLATWTRMMYSYNVFSQDSVNHHLPIPMEDSFHQQPPPPPQEEEHPKKQLKRPPREFHIQKSALSAMPMHLKNNLVGQDEAIDVLFGALKRHQVGLHDADKPLGTYIFAGPSGVGKTYLAKLLNEYFFGKDNPLVRLDCGEYQHKHENQRLIGSPPGYVGHENGGQFSRWFKKSNANVILLDEIERAHPDFWDTWLKIIDEGEFTDAKDEYYDFRQSILILTSNLGNTAISNEAYKGRAGFTSPVLGDNFKSKEPPKREMVVRMTLEAIQKHFDIPFLNRIDKTIVFNHLTNEDFQKIAELEFQLVKKKLGNKEFGLEWTPKAIQQLVDCSGVAIEGARSMSKKRVELVEDPITELLYNTKSTAGKIFTVDAKDGKMVIR
jgi:ATP-dependent Clp protease ATP-binding subunit ClpA